MPEMKLKNCPFCNCEPYLYKDGDYKPILYQIFCPAEICPLEIVQTDWYNTKEEAIAAWNTRPDGWISVKDQLPKDHKQVIITNGEWVTDGYYDSDPEADEWTNDEGLERLNVTHWMPLPAPPEAE